jgi:hypothetical protein
LVGDFEESHSAAARRSAQEMQGRGWRSRGDPNLLVSVDAGFHVRGSARYGKRETKNKTKHIGLGFPKKKNTEPESVGTAVVMYIRRAARSIC